MLETDQFIVKSAKETDNREELDSILNEIYGENKEYWPHGLSRLQMDDVYIVRPKYGSDKGKSVGFVGWQEFPEVEDGKILKTGYYVIGIRQPYRRNKYAKSAVTKIISEKSARVDRVKAFIVSSNTPSLELAKKLDIETVVKNADIGTSIRSKNLVEYTSRLHKDRQNTFRKEQDKKLKELQANQKEKDKLADAKNKFEQDAINMKQKLKDQFAKTIGNASFYPTSFKAPKLESYSTLNTSFDGSPQANPHSPSTVRQNVMQSVSGDAGIKSSSFLRPAISGLLRGAKKPVVRTTLKGLGVGAGTGGGAAFADWENRDIYGDYVPDPFKKVNYLLGGITGGTTALAALMARRNPVAAKKMLGKTLGGYTLKQVGILGGSSLQNLADSARELKEQMGELTETNLDTARTQLEAAGLGRQTAEKVLETARETYERTKGAIDPGKAILGAGILAAAGLLGHSYLSNRGSSATKKRKATTDKGKESEDYISSKPRRSGKHIRIDIPADRISDKWYNNFGREFLFDNPPSSIHPKVATADVPEQKTETTPPPNSNKPQPPAFDPRRDSLLGLGPTLSAIGSGIMNYFTPHIVRKHMPKFHPANTRLFSRDPSISWDKFMRDTGGMKQ